MFSDALSELREIGRAAVLPSDKIKKSVTEKIGCVRGNIVDLGAGTQYWSKYLSKHYQTKVYAVDSYYENGMNQEVHETGQNGGVICYQNYFECINEHAADMLWMCDVIHHLDLEFLHKVYRSIEEKKFLYVVIKDIDCRRKWGNFMNRMHDLIINKEHIHDVNPDEILEMLRGNGYKVSYEYIPKLWYPHFLIIGELEK